MPPKKATCAYKQQNCQCICRSAFTWAFQKAVHLVRHWPSTSTSASTPTSPSTTSWAKAVSWVIFFPNRMINAQMLGERAECIVINILNLWSWCRGWCSRFWWFFLRRQFRSKLHKSHHVSPAKFMICYLCRTLGFRAPPRVLLGSLRTSMTGAVLNILLRYIYIKVGYTYYIIDNVNIL